MSTEDQPPPDLVVSYYTSMSKFWQPTLLLTDFNDSPIIETTVCGRNLVAVRMGGQISVFENMCRHFQAKMSLGEVGKDRQDEDVLRCKYHGWAYNAQGICTEIPQLTDQSKIPPSAKIIQYPAREVDGILWVNLDRETELEVPTVEEEALPGMKAIPPQVNREWKTSVVRMILSALDDYHFPWLHQDVLGVRSEPYAPERSYEVSERRLVTHFQTLQPANVTNSIKDDAATSAVNYTMRVDIPNVLTLVKRNPDGGVYTVWFAAKAETYSRTPVFWKVVRNYDLGNDEKVITMEQFIQSQDIPMVNSQRPWLQKPLPVRDIDGALVRYLKLLRENNVPPNIWLCSAIV